MKQTTVSKPIVFDSESAPKRKYNNSNRIAKIKTTAGKVTEKVTIRALRVRGYLGKMEAAFMNLAMENRDIITAAGDGSIPFIMGAFVARHAISVMDDVGKIRTRVLTRMLRKLQTAGKIRVELKSKSPIGVGKLTLV